MDERIERTYSILSEAAGRTGDVSYRMVCNACGELGGWHDERAAAEADGAAHYCPGHTHDHREMPTGSIPR